MLGDDGATNGGIKSTRSGPSYCYGLSQNACCEVLALFGMSAPLLRSRVTTLIKTCRSERKAEDNQQVVTNADQLLAPSLSTLSSRFATICHNHYYVFMTAERLPRAHRTRLQRLLFLLLTANVSNKSGNLLFAQS